MNSGFTVTMQNAAAANGNGTNLEVQNFGAAGLLITGTFGATVNFEGSQDGGTNWFALSAINRSTGIKSTTATAAGLYQINAEGVDLVRARVSGYGSGSVTVVGEPLQIDAADSGVTDANGASSVVQNGAANIASGQVTAGVASGTAVAARATRRSVVIRNTDAANSVYIGPGTVTSANGFLLKFGESISIDTRAAVNCIRATADVVLAYIEVYD